MEAWNKIWMFRTSQSAMYSCHNSWLVTFWEMIYNWFFSWCANYAQNNFSFFSLSFAFAFHSSVGGVVHFVFFFLFLPHSKESTDWNGNLFFEFVLLWLLAFAQLYEGIWCKMCVYSWFDWAEIRIFKKDALIKLVTDKMVFICKMLKSTTTPEDQLSQGSKCSFYYHTLISRTVVQWCAYVQWVILWCR